MNIPFVYKRKIIASHSAVFSITNDMISIRRTIARVISCRAYSRMSNEELIKVKVNEKTGVALVTLNRPPVNSISLELLKSLDEILIDLERSKCRGMIIASVSFVSNKKLWLKFIFFSRRKQHFVPGWI